MDLFFGRRKNYRQINFDESILDPQTMKDLLDKIVKDERLINKVGNEFKISARETKFVRVGVKYGILIKEEGVYRTISWKGVACLMLPLLNINNIPSGELHLFFETKDENNWIPLAVHYKDTQGQLLIIQEEPFWSNSSIIMNFEKKLDQPEPIPQS